MPKVMRLILLLCVIYFIIIIIIIVISWASPQSFERITSQFLDNARRYMNDDPLVAEVQHVHHAKSRNKINVM